MISNRRFSLCLLHHNVPRKCGAARNRPQNRFQRAKDFLNTSATCDYPTVHFYHASIVKDSNLVTVSMAPSTNEGIDRPEETNGDKDNCLIATWPRGSNTESCSSSSCRDGVARQQRRSTGYTELLRCAVTTGLPSVSIEVSPFYSEDHNDGKMDNRRRRL